MQERFKFAIFFIIISLFCAFSKEKINLFLVLNFQNSIELNEIFFINYIFDYSIDSLMKKNDSINIFTHSTDLETDNIKNIANYIITKKGSGFFFIDCKKQEDVIYINLKLYTAQLEMLYEKEFDIRGINVSENYIEEKLSLLISYLLESIEIISKKKNIFTLNIIKKEPVKRDFPILNLALSAVSIKLYFDARTNSRIFSFFPVNLFLTFYPLKYFEIGTFISFDFEDLIFKYNFYNSNRYDYFYTSFVFLYGFFAGFSFFFDIYHYSLGISIYNIYYDLPPKTGLIKPEDYRGYLLPQIGFYNRLDIKMFKILNYSIFFSLKTVPLFIKENNYFYSNPFLFDFVIVEFSILGFSISL
ncbi:MAG TPA: hypothetical protein PLE45_00185 [Spirochaetota bacterium]|nr:hypothetical protein [Spirochaetota bacterium]HOL56001.1 hypothetical protein [Spirochaetota bacterium]HPP03443.1 hypothetical protein [Spirochaetota bacterium]